MLNSKDKGEGCSPPPSVGAADLTRPSPARGAGPGLRKIIAGTAREGFAVSASAFAYVPAYIARPSPSGAPLRYAALQCAGTPASVSRRRKIPLTPKQNPALRAGAQREESLADPEGRNRKRKRIHFDSIRYQYDSIRYQTSIIETRYGKCER